MRGMEFGSRCTTEKQGWDSLHEGVKVVLMGIARARQCSVVIAASCRIRSRSMSDTTTTAPIRKASTVMGCHFSADRATKHGREEQHDSPRDQERR